MTNHVHLSVVPQREDSKVRALGHADLHHARIPIETMAGVNISGPTGIILHIGAGQWCEWINSGVDPAFAERI